MSVHKRVDGVPSPEWVEAECQAFDRLLAAFTAEMRVQFRAKAMEGRDRWDKPEMAQEIHQAMLAHAAGIPLARGQEAHCANFLAFLWGIRLPGLGVGSDAGGRGDARGVPVQDLSAPAEPPCHHPLEGGVGGVLMQGPSAADVPGLVGRGGGHG